MRVPITQRHRRLLVYLGCLAVGLAAGALLTRGHSAPRQATIGATADAAQPSRVQQKLVKIQERVPAWVQAGGSHVVLGPLGEQVGRFLKAGRLSEAEASADQLLAILEQPPATTPAHAIQKKVEQVQEQAPRWVEAGGNPHDVMALMQTFEEHLRGGQLQEAEAVLDRALALVGSPPMENLNERRARIQQKMTSIQSQGPRWVAAGGDPKDIESRMQQFQQRMESGDVAGAEDVLDQVLALVGNAHTPSTSGETRR